MKLFKSAFLASCLVILLGMNSCKKQEYGTIGENISLQENIKGTWKVASATQVDNSAVDKGFPTAVQRLDLTSRFTYTTVVFSFQGENTGNYTITNAGNAPLFFPATGTWAIDGTQNGPVIVKLTSGNQTAYLDFAKAYRVSDNKLSLKFTRKDSNGKIYLSYEFNFNRN
ncbi:lipocalin family protein [Pelobium sp.]|nr:lipocalin family protein [Pelobium sp.]MDA9555421.1 lipocalin family protein [Pelobium sp.]